MPDIILTTLNAKYIHAAFGLRYLLANLGELQSRACLVEFDIHQRPLDIAEVLLARNPKIIGLGVYIWNVTEMTELVSALKRLRPDLIVILGGPEVSYETGQQEIVRLADHVITGEADLKFAEVCRALLAPDTESTSSVSQTSSLPKIIPADLPDLAKLALPYGLYTDDDIAHRVIYVEASRGCPFTCEFCLSSLDIPVRQFPLATLLAELDTLLARGVKQFKFVDRTFNLNLNVSRALLHFFHERLRPGLFLHFEMIPDRLPDALRELIRKFPPGALQFEVGIQTFDEATSKNISRRQDYAKLADNFHFLREQTGVHIHADLIVGLPGETVESFGAGFDRLVALQPQEIQVGILKRLRGTPIVRHDAEWRMVNSAEPPYEILQNRLIDFATMQRLRRFARFWDLVANSGNFIETTPLLWASPAPLTLPLSPPRGEGTGEGHAAASPGPLTPALSPGGGEGARRAGERAGEGHAAASPSPLGGERAGVRGELVSPFAAFLGFSDWLFAQVGRQHSIALAHLAELLFKYLTGELHHDPKPVAEFLRRDYLRGGRRDPPSFLQPYLPEATAVTERTDRSISLKRQARHHARPVAHE